MPTYCYKCPGCGSVKEVVRSMLDSDTVEECNCRRSIFHIMRRDFQAEHSAVRGDYDDPIVSNSMAFDARDISEHRRQHPGVEIVTDGFSAYPKLNSLSQKRKYMNKRGWQDKNAWA